VGIDERLVGKAVGKIRDLWWLKTYLMGSKKVDTNFADGWGGQWIIVVPEFELVIVFTGDNYEGEVPIDEYLTHYILSAVKGARD